MDRLFDPQILVSVGLAVMTVLIVLIVLAVLSRRVRYLTSEVQSLKQEVGLLDDAVRTVSGSLGEGRAEQGKAEQGKAKASSAS